MEFADESHGAEWWQKLQRQRENARYCDVVFHIEDKELPAHRNILAAQSAYFSSVFNAHNVAKEHITVPCQNPESMEQLLLYLYTGKVTIRESTVFEILKLASTYLLSFLKTCCKKFLEAEISLQNCLVVYDNAERYALNDLKSTVEEYIRKHISLVVMGKELLQYSFEQIASFLWNKKWAVSDTSKFLSVCHWVNTNQEANMKYFTQLLTNIWLGEVPVQSVADVFEACAMFKSDLVKKKVFDAMNSQQSLPVQYMELFQKLASLQEQTEQEILQTPENQKNEGTKADVYSALGTSDHSNAGSDSSDGELTELAVVKVTNIETRNDTDAQVDDKNDDVADAVILVYKEKGESPSRDLGSNKGELDQSREEDHVQTPATNEEPLNIEPTTKADTEESEDACELSDPDDSDYEPETSVKPLSIVTKHTFSDRKTNKISRNRRNKKISTRKQSKQASVKSRRVPDDVVPKVRIKLQALSKLKRDKRKQRIPRKIGPVPVLKRKRKRKAKGSEDEDSDDDDTIPKRRGRKRRLSLMVCELCSFRTTNEERFKKHERLAHKDGITFKCHWEGCDYESNWNREYYRHMKKHYKGPPYQCDCEECEYTSDRIQFLLLHRMKHTNERPYECTICNSKFRNKWTLTTHLKIHTGERPFVCPICNQAFGTKGTMQQHMVSHSDARPYLCDICGFTTKYQSHLTTHKRIHTGNVFRCSVCDYFTPKRNQLQNHMKIHLAIRSYVCTLCGRAFTEKSHLVRHERIHTPDKPFKCDQCSYASNRRDKLKEHVAKHHTPGVPAKTPYRPRKARKLVTGTEAAALAKEAEEVLAEQVEPAGQSEPQVHAPQTLGQTVQPQILQNFTVSDPSKGTMHPQSLYLGYNTDGMLLAGQMVTTTDSTVDGQLLGLTHITTHPQGALTEGQVVDPRLLTHMMAQSMQPTREMTPVHHTPTPPLNQGQVSQASQQAPQQQPDSVTAYITLSKF